MVGLQAPASYCSKFLCIEFVLLALYTALVCIVPVCSDIHCIVLPCVCYVPFLPCLPCVALHCVAIASAFRGKSLQFTAIAMHGILFTSCIASLGFVSKFISCMYPRLQVVCARSAFLILVQLTVKPFVGTYMRAAVSLSRVGPR